MTDTEKFLNEFKRLEQVLRETKTADSVLDYENSLQTSVEDTYDRLKLCRICRNYLAHHPDGNRFLVPTPAMIKFLGEEADKVESKIQHVKDVMVRQKAVTLNTPLKDVITAVAKSKFGWTAVTDNDGHLAGVIDSRDMTGFIAKKMSLTGKLSSVVDEAGLKKIIKNGNIGITSPESRADDIYKAGYDKIVVCKDKVYKGIVK